MKRKKFYVLAILLLALAVFSTTVFADLDQKTYLPFVMAKSSSTVAPTPGLTFIPTGNFFTTPGP